MNWRTPITMLVLLAVLLGAAYYGWQTVVSPGGDDKAAATTPTPNQPSCKKKVQFKQGERVVASDVVVNVYNAGTTSGLAGETLDQLVSNGFMRGVADNAPDTVAAKGVTILTDGKGSPELRLVALQFDGPATFKKGPDLTAGVDILVGDEATGVDPEAQTFARVKRTVRACVPSESGSD